MASVHGFLAGSDRGNRMVQWSALVVLVIVVFLVFVRLLSPSRSNRLASVAAPVAAGR
jgi:hypothetical protein